jgi:hypothetical protein
LFNLISDSPDANHLFARVAFIPPFQILRQNSAVADAPQKAKLFDTSYRHPMKKFFP